ncbi:hypothetical protein HDU84_000342 [Entophlyctis sp. JEL0112]|nr:hypothetical protein HDU84_000342 [Entophlyctis sp. JEL0112]
MSALKPVIIMFKKGTLPEVVESAKNEIRARNGTIKHEYTTLNGFAASVPEDTLASFATTTWSQHIASLEEDGEVSILADAAK